MLLRQAKSRDDQSRRAIWRQLRAALDARRARDAERGSIPDGRAGGAKTLRPSAVPDTSLASAARKSRPVAARFFSNEKFDHQFRPMRRSFTYARNTGSVNT